MMCNAIHEKKTVEDSFEVLPLELTFISVPLWNYHCCRVFATCSKVRQIGCTPLHFWMLRGACFSEESLLLKAQHTCIIICVQDEQKLYLWLWVLVKWHKVQMLVLSLAPLVGPTGLALYSAVWKSKRLMTQKSTTNDESCCCQHSHIFT